MPCVVQQHSRTDVERPRDRKEGSEPPPPELRPVEQGPNSTPNSTVVCRVMTVMTVMYVTHRKVSNVSSKVSSKVSNIKYRVKYRKVSRERGVIPVLYSAQACILLDL